MTPLAPNQSNNEARAAIMQSIRAHLASSPTIELIHAPVIANEQVAAVAHESSPVETFVERLESVGGHCLVVRDEADAAAALADIVSALQGSTSASRVALSDASLIARLTQGLEVEMAVSPAAADLFNYDIGISTAQAGITETGTLILEAEKERNRLVSLLPPVHIAVVNSRDLHLTIGDALAALRHENSLSRAITFITGPSRTADIELTLTVGVHGPKELHVIIIDDGSIAPSKSD